MTSRVSAAAALLLCLDPTRAFQQNPAFRSTIEAVRVDVLVTDKGQPVRGLRAADFEVLDNGVPQTVDLLNFEQAPVNVILALDLSGSVEGARLDQLRTAGRELLGGLKPHDKAALLTFSHVVTLGAQLTTDIAGVQGALDRTEPSGNTSLVDASYAGLIVGESDPGRSLVILFSDGVDTLSWLSADAVLDAAKRSDVVVYGVSAGRERKAAFIEDLSTLTGGKRFAVESTKNLGAVFLAVLEEFRHRYLVSYTPRGVSATGWHRLDVRVKGRSVTVKARPGYQAGS